MGRSTEQGQRESHGRPQMEDLNYQILFVKKKYAIEFDEAKYQKRLKIFSAIDEIKKCKSLKIYVARYDYFRSYSTTKDYLLMLRLSQSVLLQASVAF